MGCVPVSQALFRGHPLSTSLKVLELCFKVRVVCGPLWKSLETVSSIISCVALGFYFKGQCLENRSLVVFCYNGLSLNI